MTFIFYIFCVKFVSFLSVYDEVPDKLKEWTEQQSILLGIYSSGSVLAQRLLFGHTSFGDLTKVGPSVYLHRLFITTNFAITSTFHSTSIQMLVPSKKLSAMKELPHKLSCHRRRLFSSPTYQKVTSHCLFT